MFGEGFDMDALLQQAQAMQAQLQQAQADQAARVFTGTAGGDLVELELTGLGDLVALRIKPEALDPSDPEGISDLIIAAFRAAKAQSDDAAAASIPQIPGLPL